MALAAPHTSAFGWPPPVMPVVDIGWVARGQVIRMPRPVGRRDTTSASAPGQQAHGSRIASEPMRSAPSTRYDISERRPTMMSAPVKSRAIVDIEKIDSGCFDPDQGFVL